MCVSVSVCVYESLSVCVSESVEAVRGSLRVMCVYESLSVCVSMSAAGEGLHCRYSERYLREALGCAC